MCAYLSVSTKTVELVDELLIKINENFMPLESVLTVSITLM